MKTTCVSARMNNSIPTLFLRATPITLFFSHIEGCVLWKFELQGFRKNIYFTTKLANKILLSYISLTLFLLNTTVTVMFRCAEFTEWKKQRSECIIIVFNSVLPFTIYNNNNNNNNNYYYYYLLQLGCNPVAVVMLHVYKTWNWLLLNLSWEGYMRSVYWQLGVLGTISAFAFRHRETKKNLCRGGRSQDLPNTDF